MSVMTERKFAVQVVYNGVTKALQVDPGRSSKPRTHTPPSALPQHPKGLTFRL